MSSHFGTFFLRMKWLKKLIQKLSALIVLGRNFLKQKNTHTQKIKLREQIEINTTENL